MKRTFDYVKTARWSVRGNLMLVNLIVIGLVVWLTISFLSLAISQREQAAKFGLSVKTQTAIFDSTSAFSAERNEFQLSLLSVSARDDTQIENLKSRVAQSRSASSALQVAVQNQIREAETFKHIPATKSQLEGLISLLYSKLSEIDTYRNLAFKDLSLSLEDRNQATADTLFDLHNAIIKLSVRLMRKLQYLPEAKASSVAYFNVLLFDLTTINKNLTLKNAILNKLLLDDRHNTAIARAQLQTLNSKIDQQLLDLSAHAQASLDNTNLHQKTLSLEKFYNKEYRPVDLTVLGDSPLSQTSVDKSGWETSQNSIEKIIQSIFDEGSFHTKLLAKKESERATRNLVIDVFLTLLCGLITVTSVLLNRRIKQLAYNDKLTGLPNRINFESAVLGASESTAQKNKKQAIIFIDLDRFKAINDNYGHAIGDELIKVVATRLQEECCSGELLARLGGDEFGVFINEVKSIEAVEALATRLLDIIKQDITIKELNLRVGASAGFSISPDDCPSGTDLLRNADIAMYHSKANKLEVVYRFNNTIATDYQHRLELELDLKRALERNEFTLCYQPKVCTSSGRVKGVEALLRWQHKERGFISPAEFIPIAEDIGLMGKLGNWVLNTAIKEIAELQRNEDYPLQVAVNISAQQFGDKKFLETVHEAVSTHGFSNYDLELEVTESLVMYDVKRVISLLSSLKSSGIRIAIDDFGTGYSSLQYLQELPLDTLKIDRAFILALDDSDPADSVANSIVQLATLFNLETVAEGVETDAQDYKIRSLGVDHIQGYRYSKPVPITELSQVISDIAEQQQTPDRKIRRKAA